MDARYHKTSRKFLKNNTEKNNIMSSKAIDLPDRELAAPEPEVGYNLMLDWIKSNHRYWHSNFIWWVGYYFQRQQHYWPLRAIFIDLNYDDKTLAKCYGLAIEMGDRIAKDIVSLLQAMTLPQRQLVIHSAPFERDIKNQSVFYSSFFRLIERIDIGRN